MAHKGLFPSALVTCGTLFLSACATAPVLHTEMQLNEVGTRCGFALGERGFFLIEGGGDGALDDARPHVG